MNNWKEIAKILLESRGCWANGEVEIPEEISAQFDITLNEAREIERLARESNL